MALAAFVVLSVFGIALTAEVHPPALDFQAIAKKYVGKAPVVPSLDEAVAEHQRRRELRKQWPNLSVQRVAVPHLESNRHRPAAQNFEESTAPQEPDGSAGQRPIGSGSSDRDSGAISFLPDNKGGISPPEDISDIFDGGEKTQDSDATNDDKGDSSDSNLRDPTPPVEDVNDKDETINSNTFGDDSATGIEQSTVAEEALDDKESLNRLPVARDAILQAQDLPASEVASRFLARKLSRSNPSFVRRRNTLRRADRYSPSKYSEHEALADVMPSDATESSQPSETTSPESAVSVTTSPPPSTTTTPESPASVTTSPPSTTTTTTSEWTVSVTTSPPPPPPTTTTTTSSSPSTTPSAAPSSPPLSTTTPIYAPQPTTSPPSPTTTLTTTPAPPSMSSTTPSPMPTANDSTPAGGVGYLPPDSQVLRDFVNLFTVGQPPPEAVDEYKEFVHGKFLDLGEKLSRPIIDFKIFWPTHKIFRLEGNCYVMVFPLGCSQPEVRRCFQMLFCG